MTHQQVSTGRHTRTSDLLTATLSASIFLILFAILIYTLWQDPNPLAPFWQGLAEFLRLDLGWMDWTKPTATFFLGLGIALTFMTLWDVYNPSVKHKGFMPISLTRGDKFFLVIISLIGILLIWLGFFPNDPFSYPASIAALWAVVLALWG